MWSAAHLTVTPDDSVLSRISCLSPECARSPCTPLPLTMLIPDRLRQVRELKDDSWATRWLAMGHSGPTVSMWAHRAEKVSLRRLWQQQQQQQEEETAAAAAAAAGAVSGMGGGGSGRHATAHPSCGADICHAKSALHCRQLTFWPLLPALLLQEGQVVTAAKGPTMRMFTYFVRCGATCSTKLRMLRTGGWPKCDVWLPSSPERSSSSTLGWRRSRAAAWVCRSSKKAATTARQAVSEHQDKRHNPHCCALAIVRWRITAQACLTQACC